MLQTSLLDFRSTQQARVACSEELTEMGEAVILRPQFSEKLVIVE
jgi:hypothetical protein